MVMVRTMKVTMRMRTIIIFKNWKKSEKNNDGFRKIYYKDAHLYIAKHIFAYLKTENRIQKILTLRSHTLRKSCLFLSNSFKYQIEAKFPLKMPRKGFYAFDILE